MRDRVCVVGHGKLASAIQQGVCQTARRASVPIVAVDNWDDLSRASHDPTRVVFVHAGSGRQFRDVLAYCASHSVPLIQTSTGMANPDDCARALSFPLVDAPNLSLPMVKFLCMLEQMRPLFAGCPTSITESHQSTKTSPPGTAIEIARLLGVNESCIRSVRDEQAQVRDLGIPLEHLRQHAVHVVEIINGACKITFRTEVFGLETYVEGLVHIVRYEDKLPTGRHRLTDLIRDGII